MSKRTTPYIVTEIYINTSSPTIHITAPHTHRPVSLTAPIAVGSTLHEIRTAVHALFEINAFNAQSRLTSHLYGLYGGSKTLGPEMRVEVRWAGALVNRDTEVLTGEDYAAVLNTMEDRGWKDVLVVYVSLVGRAPARG